MNKKGVGFDMETLVAFLIIVLVGVALIMAWNTFSGKGFNQLKNVQDKVTDSSFLDLTILGKKSQLLEEKEKCDKFQNPNDCMGTNKEKTGCFWGKIDNKVACYSCIVKKSYFGQNFGKCHSYLNVFLSPRDPREGETFLTRSVNEIDAFICNNNPCNFESTKFGNNKIVKDNTCIFRDQVEDNDFTQLVCQ